MTITLIAAVARNGVIGADGGIPWRLPGEQARFKEATMGHTLVMGRATYESIGRPLPGRTTIVLSRDPGWSAAGVRTAASFEDALALAQALAQGSAQGLAQGDVYVAGGATVYAQALPHADAQLLTEVDLEPDGDTYYPDFDREQWRETERERHEGWDVVRWERAPAPIR